MDIVGRSSIADDSLEVSIEPIVLGTKDQRLGLRVIGGRDIRIVVDELRRQY